MTHLESTIALYEEHDIDAQGFIDWHMRHGVVFSSNDGFAMGFRSHREEPDQPVYCGCPDTLFVSMCCGDMRKCLGAFQSDFKFISFQREFKNSPMVRTYPMDRFIKALNKNSNHGK